MVSMVWKRHKPVGSHDGWRVATVPAYQPNEKIQMQPYDICGRMAKDPLMQAQEKRLLDINSQCKGSRKFKRLKNESW